MKILSYYQGDPFQSCQRCGKVISWVAIVSDDQAKELHVGVDCASTLASMKFTPAKTIKILKARQVKKTQDDYRYLSDYFKAELRIDHMIRSNNGQLIYNYGYLA